MTQSKSNLAIVSTALGRADARRLARLIIEERQAACVQTCPIRSFYYWKGRFESASEVLLMAKTTARRARSLMKFIKSHHPYELPEIVVMPITDALDDYCAWVECETKPMLRRSKRT